MSGATIAGAFRFFSRGNEMAHFKRTRNQVPVTSSFKLTYRRWLLCINARTCTRGRVYVANPRVTGREEVVNNFQSCVFPSYISARCVHTMLALLQCCIRKRALCSRDRLSREIGLHSDAPTVEARDSAAKKKMSMYVCM